MPIKKAVEVEIYSGIEFTCFHRVALSIKEHMLQISSFAEDEKKKSRGRVGGLFGLGRMGNIRRLKIPQSSIFTPSCYSFPFFSVCILPLDSSQWL